MNTANLILYFMNEDFREKWLLKNSKFRFSINPLVKNDFIRILILFLSSKFYLFYPIILLFYIFLKW